MMLGAGGRRVRSAGRSSSPWHNGPLQLSLEQQLDVLALGRVSQQLLGRVVDAVVSHTA